MYVGIYDARQDQKVVQVGSFVGSGHVGFFADFEDFAVFDGDAALYYFLFQVGFGVVQYRVNNQVRRTRKSV
jgi:hypothetical protein